MRIYFVDAFTDKPFAGNPAAVVLWQEKTFPSVERMQRLASQINLSETAFAHRLPSDGEAHWALRWFTPSAEVRMCGHATLATAHVLRTALGVSGTVSFDTLSGVLTTTVRDTGRLTMDFPSAPLTRTTTPAALATALDQTPVRSAWLTGPDVGDLLVELETERAVRGLTPDFASLAALGTRGVIATAPAARPFDEVGYDFVSRCFFPGAGINEDPVTGSAHTALAPFWAQRYGRQDLTGLQASARTGLVRAQVRGARTLLTGAAVTVMEAELRVPF